MQFILQYMVNFTLFCLYTQATSFTYSKQARNNGLFTKHFFEKKKKNVNLEIIDFFHYNEEETNFKKILSFFVVIYFISYTL